ncbi:MAG: YhbY family RNA-binding protein [Gammaproteobacteria bacterium]|jgi:RNA-binding protein
MKALTEKQKREFRRLGHKLRPVVTIGNAGLTGAILREVDLSLEHHELMKIRIQGTGREERRQCIATICAQCHAVLVQAIGNIALLYRKRKTALSGVQAAPR